MPVSSKIGNYLYQVLANEVNNMKTLFGSYDNSANIINDFKTQLSLYAHQQAPFGRHNPGKMTPLQCWNSLLTRPGAMKLFLFMNVWRIAQGSLLNSMGEEQTVSTFTKMNTADHGGKARNRKVLQYVPTPPATFESQRPTYRQPSWQDC